MRPLQFAGSEDSEAVKWSHVHHSDQFAPQVMDRAGGNGRLHIIQWLHENRGEGCTTYAMDGHLNVVLYLLEHKKEGFQVMQ
ncbi:hypothetical protein JG687_00005702 [Phytophthora cactorum]|uniref:Ankyrin repeat-containing domain n=1 Tax=Phytophthora cactorum TaxID=29920 RepID=A0A8T1ULF8_9STRA|nr:hypothetical protein JG687_00005702 [Phytophthora cactorum]